MTPDRNLQTTTMRAAVVPELGAPLTVSEVLLPTPGPRGTLVKLETSGRTGRHRTKGGRQGRPHLALVVIDYR